MLTLGRLAAVGALATLVALLSPPALATPGPAPATVRPAEVVGGPELASAGIVVHLGPGSRPLPAVNADSWLVADLTTGDVLAAKAAHRRALPASMLKTLTAVTLMPRLDPSTVVTASYDEARADGGHVGLVPGATYTVWDLWHGLLLPSANDAAAALADANGGMATTVGQMQAMAHQLRALDTTVRNDSGLDNPAQLSSAYDMTLIARAAMGIPDFRTVTASTHYSFPGLMPAAGKQRSTYMIYSQNRLLLHGYPGTIGGKTGFTSLAHRTFWGAATRGGHTLVVTLFQVHDPTEKAARALLDWGFASVGHVTPVGHLVDPVGPSPAAAPAGTVAAGSPTSAGAAAAASSRFRLPWLPVGLVLVLLGALALWWRRRRPGRRGWVGAVASGPVAPGSPARRVEAARDDTAPLAVVAPPPGPPVPVVARDTVAVPGAAPVAVPPPTDEAPDDLPVPTVRPAPTSGGHVRLVTRPSRDEPS